MKTKNIFKTLVLAAVLVSACGKNEIADDFKGYTLPVTVNVTREGNDATKAKYTDKGDGTGSLAFSEGDKLFVEANYSDADQFAGLLDYDAGSGKFSGTIYTEKEYTGTAEELLKSASALMATLLPAGYDTNGYGYLSISNAGAYNADLLMVRNKVCALTKKEAVEQLSFESVDEYNNGFALAPQNAVVCFSISGLTAKTAVEVIFEETYGDPVSPVNVTTDASGVATFAAGMPRYANFNWYSLTVDGYAIALPEDKEVVAGKIYNMSRSATPTAYTLAESTVGMIVGSDGNAYAVDKDDLPSGVTAVAMVAYKSGSNGLAIQLNGFPAYMNWAEAKTYAAGLTEVPGGGTWRLPSKEDWQNMFVGCAVSGDATSASDYMEPIAGFKAKIAATGITWWSEYYWSSTESGSDAWYVSVYLEDGDAYADFYEGQTSEERYVLGCLAF